MDQVVTERRSVVRKSHLSWPYQFGLGLDLLPAGWAAAAAGRDHRQARILGLPAILKM